MRERVTIKSRLSFTGSSGRPATDGWATDAVARGDGLPRGAWLAPEPNAAFAAHGKDVDHGHEQQRRQQHFKEQRKQEGENHERGGERAERCVALDQILATGETLPTCHRGICTGCVTGTRPLSLTGALTLSATVGQHVNNKHAALFNCFLAVLFVCCHSALLYCYCSTVFHCYQTALSDCGYK